MTTLLELETKAASFRLSVSGSGDHNAYADVNFLGRYKKSGDFTITITTTPVVFCMEPGSREGQILENGHYLETFIAFATDAENIEAERTRVEKIFELAADQEESQIIKNEVVLYDRAREEVQERRAHVYGGSISPIDQEIVTSNLNRGAGLYAITIERDPDWDIAGYRFSKFGRVGVHGGRVGMYGITRGGLHGRVSATTIVPADGGWFQRGWLGIKTSLNTTADLMAGFSPVIDVKMDTIVKSGEDKGVIQETSSSEDPTGFFDNEGVRIDFSEKPDWYYRFRCPMRKWNIYTSFSNRKNRKLYRGKYILLLRYKTNEIDETGVVRYGLEPAIGWSGVNDVTPLKRQYLEPTNGVFKYKNLGEISIGGRGWSPSVDDRLLLSEFSIFFQCALINGDSNTDSISFDNMILLPTDSWMYVELDENIGPDRRVEIHIDSSNYARGFIIDNEAGDDSYNPLETPRDVYREVPNINSGNWHLPTLPGAVLVHVADIEDNTKWKTGWNDVYIQTTPRAGGPYKS